MKKVINGKMYNTETAEQLATWDNGRWNSFDICEEKLFRKRNGEFFLYGYGGPKSAYAQPDGGEWAEEHLNGDEYEAIFGVVGEDESLAAITISISANAMDCGQRAAAKRGISLPALIEALLQNA